MSIRCCKTDSLSVVCGEAVEGVILAGSSDIVMACGLSLKRAFPHAQVGNLEAEPSQSHAVGMSAGELFNEESDLED